MSSPDLQAGSRAFVGCWRKVDLVSWIPAQVAILGYLVLRFDLAAVESLALGLCLIASALFVFSVGEIRRRLRKSPIVHYLDQQPDKGVSGGRPLDSSSAFRAIVSLPFRMQWTRFVGGLVSIAVVPVLMWVVGYGSWLGFDRIRGFAMIAIVVSLSSGMFLFYWAKQRFAPWRALLAKASGHSQSPPNAGVKHSLQTKFLLAVTLPTLATLLLVIDVMNGNSVSKTEDAAANWAMLALESISLVAPDLPLVERIASELPREKFWPMPIEIFEIHPHRLEASSSVDLVSRGFLDVLDREIELGRTNGLVLPEGRSEIGAFRRLDDGTILVGTVMRPNLEPTSGGIDWVVGVVCLSMLVLAAAISRLAAGEVMRGVAILQAAAARIAGGDLSPGEAGDFDDELAEAENAIDLVRETLRATLSRFSDTAERVERIASGVSTVAGDVVAKNAKQALEIHRSNQLLGLIEGRAGEASLSVASLREAIDESSSSVIELGAAGVELNETASLLSSKVDAVSGSLEQMVGGVQQVAGTSDKLVAASEETCSSMEEMANSMRAVDTSAETTAALSADVVLKAELGQAKVVQTIAGMEAIREATDAAENVIRGLGARTKEIGGILDVIDDVADETNLLALNAAIIAAQAGDQGKAFSVVADEIKELADRVLASTKEIGELVRAVQEEGENAIGAIELGSASVMSGVDLSAEAGRTLEEITVASRESGTRISEIVISVREQTKAASHVAALMDRVRESAEEIGMAGTEQSRGNEVVYESALTMREVAQQMRRTTEEQAGGFRRIQQDIEGVRDAVDEITGSLGEQTDACNEITDFLGSVSQRMQSNDDAAEKMLEATRELMAHSELLREDSKRFRS